MNNSELQLADQVYRVRFPELGLSVVKQIKDGAITFFRPYPHTADFSSTGGVICYIGIEEWTEEADDTRNDWVLVARTTLK
jgi:hypothetical protein